MGNITIRSRVPQSAGSEGKVEGVLRLSSSYATGGDSYTAKQFGLSQINGLELQTASGFAFQPVYSTSKIKALRVGIDTISTQHNHELTQANENLAVVANVATSAGFPVCVNSVYVTAGGVTGPFKVIPYDKVPATGECAVRVDTRTFTFLGADAVTAVQVSYVDISTSTDDIGSAVGTLEELPATSNLSAIDIPFVAYGY